jgi:hypothetical protein
MCIGALVSRLLFMSGFSVKLGTSTWLSRSRGQPETRASSRRGETFSALLEHGAGKCAGVRLPKGEAKTLEPLQCKERIRRWQVFSMVPRNLILHTIVAM